MLWRNWAGNQVCSPARVALPASPDEIAAVVTEAASEGLPVKPVGAAHSFSAVAVTEGVQVSLDRWRGLISADPETGLVTLRAGTRLREVPALLAPYGLAMANLGDIDAQSIAGAISTGTHGTGHRFGGLSTQVRALGIVLADGSHQECSPEHEPELFGGARLGLGALGVITTVTLQCVPAFGLAATESPERFEAIVGEFDTLSADHDHAEFFWFPHTDRALVKVNDRLPSDASLTPPGRVAAYVNEELLSNSLFGVLCQLGHTAPAAIPPINRVSAKVLGSRSYSDLSHRVFASPRRVRFREMEYGVPRETLGDVLREVRRRIEQRGCRVSFPLEVRTAAADDVWLSTAYQRETAYIAVHQYWKTDHRTYFDTVEEVFRAFDGRPHWGKLHTLDAEALEPLYPRFGDFLTLRDRVDPDRRFASDHLTQVLGK
jgi:FAD-linked oxidoreductase